MIDYKEGNKCQPKNNPLGPEKVKKTPKLSQNQTSELKETKKIKIIALYE